MHRRAQSEVIGFVLVFSLVVSLVAIISVFGFGALEDTRDQEELKNAERAFDVLADNMADIHQEGAPSRATEISLQSADLYVGDPVNFNITLSGPEKNLSRPLEPIVFGIGETDIVYVGGAILRDQRDGGFMVKEPPFLISSDRLVLPIIETRQKAGASSVSGGTIRIRAVRVDRQYINDMVRNPSPYNSAIINVTSPRSEIWERYFEKQDGMSCEDTALANNIRCSISDPDTIYVSRTVINWEIES